MSNPYRAFRFRLEIGYIQVAGFSECTGLQAEVQVEKVEEGGRNTHALKFPKVASLSDITLKRGLIQSEDLWEWFQSVLKGQFDHANRRPENVDRDIGKNMTIVLLNEEGKDVKRWKIKRPLPIKWQGPDLKATDNGVAFESLVIAHEGIEMSTP